MKLTALALKKIKEPKVRMQIALALGVTDQSIINYIKRNDDELTKAAALELIRKETGLSDDQILVKEIVI